MKNRHLFLPLAAVLSLVIVSLYGPGAVSAGQSPPASNPTPTPSPTPAPAQTYAGLQNDIRAAVSKFELRRGSVGLKVVALDSGKVVFEENSEKFFMPASNNKSFSVAVALDRLGPDFRTSTSVFAHSKPNGDGVIKGSVSVYGRGDVSISGMFHDGDPLKGIDALAEKIVAAGIKKIDGDLIGDDTYFSGDAVPSGWELDDLSTYYGAEVSALPVNDNAVDVTVVPGTVGTPCAVQLKPVVAVINVVNKCTTAAAGTRRTLSTQRSIETGTITVEGTVAADDKEVVRSVAVTRPAAVFVSLLKDRLAAKGITVGGRARAISPGEKSVAAAGMTEIARMDSAPLGEIAARTMKPSQNMFTEVILRMVGERLGDKSDSGVTSADRGIAVVRGFIKGIGIPEDGYMPADGSGLSRHNIVTPSTLITLYTYMAKQSKYSQAWIDSLPIGGVDGTIRNRFKGTVAMNNVRAKTGTINQVSGLSGYVTTAAGERLVFSMLVNGVPDAALRVSTIDEVVGALAAFNGKIP